MAQNEVSAIIAEVGGSIDNQTRLSSLLAELGWEGDSISIISSAIVEVAWILDPPLVISQMPVEIAYIPTIHISNVAHVIVEIGYEREPYTGPVGIYGYGVAHG